MLKNFIIVFIIISLIWVYLSACNKQESTQDIPAVSNFELNKYLGDWYEIARLPHSFEKDMEYVKANYSLNPDGSVGVLILNNQSSMQQVIFRNDTFTVKYNVPEKSIVSLIWQE